MATHLFHVAVEGVVAGPEDDSNSTITAVGDQLRYINLRYHLHQIGFQVDGPSLVEDHILDAMFRGEVDVVLVGIVIDAGLEVDIVDIPVVPPLPGYLSGLDPGGIGQP